MSQRRASVGRDMTRKKSAPPKPGRYDIRAITLRVERERVRHHLEVKELAEMSGLTQANWYKKAGAQGGGKAPRSPFTVEELGRIAEALKAPPCWPFDEWSLLERIRFDANGPKRQ